MQRLLREPLVHFLLIGAALFAAYAAVADDSADERSIVVTAGRVEHLATLFERTWQRAPTRRELEGLVRDFVREEAAYRESQALGLDRDDTVVRRRMRQKMEFVAEELGAEPTPTEEQLAAHLAANLDDFRIDPELDLRQVYFDAAKRGEAVGAQLRETRDLLRGDPQVDAAALGDHTLLQHAYRGVSSRDLVALFGADFTEAVLKLPVGSWQGPVESGYGLHLVRVDRRAEGRVPELDEVRVRVLRSWEDQRRDQAIEAFYEQLVGQFEVRVEWPAAAAERP